MPFTPSMKLKAFTKPASHVAIASPSGTRAGTGRLNPETSRPATTTPPAPCSASRANAGSPRRSSTRPRAPKKPTAARNADASLPLAAGAKATASSTPAAIGAPPPRGVGTECDDRSPGTSMTASRRSAAIVSGSATATITPQADTAHTTLSPDTGRSVAELIAVSN
jgi:hypothetical protein